MEGVVGRDRDIGYFRVTISCWYYATQNPALRTWSSTASYCPSTEQTATLKHVVIHALHVRLCLYTGLYAHARTYIFSFQNNRAWWQVLLLNTRGRIPLTYYVLHHIMVICITVTTSLKQCFGSLTINICIICITYITNLLNVDRLRSRPINFMCECVSTPKTTLNLLIIEADSEKWRRKGRLKWLVHLTASSRTQTPLRTTTSSCGGGTLESLVCLRGSSAT